MKARINRLFALFTALIMIVNIMPITASADTYVSDPDSITYPMVDSIKLTIGDGFEYTPSLYLIIRKEVHFYNNENYKFNSNQYAWIKISDKTSSPQNFSISSLYFSDDSSSHTQYTNEADRISVYLATGPASNYENAINNLDDLKNAQKFYSGSTIGNKSVSVAQGTDNVNVIIGSAGPVPHTISVANWPSGVPNYYYVVAKVGNSYVYSDIEECIPFNLSDAASEIFVVFYNQTVSNVSSLTSLAHVTEFDYNGNHYALSIGEPVSNNYPITVTQLSKCSVEFANSYNDSSIGSGYYVIAYRNNQAVAFAPLTESSEPYLTFINSSGNNHNDNIFDDTTFVIIKDEQFDRNKLKGFDISKYTEGTSCATSSGKHIGDIKFTWNSNPANKIYTITAVKQTKDVSVTIVKAEDSLDIDLSSGAYYLVAGWNDGNDSYSAQTLDNTLTGSYDFNTADLPHVGTTLFILLKRYDQETSDPRGQDGTAIVSDHRIEYDGRLISDTTNILELDGYQYSFAMTGPVETDGVKNYTITVTKTELPKYTVTLAAEDGIDTTYYCAVLRWNISGQDYYAFAEFNNGTPQYFTTLEKQNGTIAYDPSVQISEAYVIPGNASNHDYRVMTTWGNDWRKYNGQDINGKVVAIDITSSTTNAIVTIGETVPATYAAALSFTEGGAETTPSDLASGYYLVAKDKDNKIYYAPVTSAGIGTIVYPDTEHTFEDNKFPEITEFKFVQYTGDSVSVASLEDLSKLTAFGEYEITYPESATEGVYQFAANKPITCTANIVFVDAEGQPDTVPALDTGYTYYVAVYNNGTVSGTARFTGSGDLSFSSGTNINDTTTFKIQRVKDGNTETVESSGGKLGMYTFTWGSAVNTVYTITAKKDRTYTARLDFNPSENVSLGSDPFYVLVKGEGSSYKYYAQVTTQGFGSFIDASGNVVTEMAGIAGFEFVNAGTATVNNINSLTGLAKITNEGTIGEYYTVSIPGSAENNVFAITATKQENKYYMLYKDKDNKQISGITLPTDGHYYVLARIGETPVFYAPWPAETGTDPIAFTDGTTSGITVIPDVTLELRRTASEATTVADVYGGTYLPQLTDANGKKYTLKFDAQHSRSAKEHDIVATEVSEENVVVIDFLDEEGNPDESAALSGKYYLVLEGNYPVKYYAPITISGTKAILGQFINTQDGTTYTIPVDATNIQYGRIVSYSGEGDLPWEYIRDKYDYDQSGLLKKAADCNNGVTLERYSLTFNRNRDTSDQNFHITAQRRVGYQAILQFKDSSMQNSVTPGEGTAPEITGYSWAVAELYEGEDSAATFIGYAVEPISTSSSSSTVVFDRFRLVQPNGNSYSDTNDYISYTDAKAANYYVRRVSIGHSQGNNPPDSYNNAKNLDYSDYDGYTFVSNRRDNYVSEQDKGDPRTAKSSTITIRVAEPTDYYVKMDCGEEPLTIPEGYSIYAKVTAVHTESTREAVVKLDTTTDGGKTYLGKVETWYNGENPDNKEKINGHEKEMKVELYVVPSSTSIAKPSDLAGKTLLRVGEAIQTHTITSYPDIFKDKENPKDNSTTNRTIKENPADVTTITDIVFLEENEDQFNLYSIEKLLNGGYNVITLCDGPYESMPKDVVPDAWTGAVGQGDAFIGCHQMGSILIRGDVTFASKVTGMADSPMADNPSVVGGFIGNTQAYGCFVNNRTNNDDDVPFYAGSTNTVLGNMINGHLYNQQLGGVDHGFNYCGTTVVSDDYVDWNRLQRTVKSASAALADASERTISAVNGQTVTITPGENVTIDCPAGAVITVNINAGEQGFVPGVGNNGESIMIPNPELPGTVINFKNTGNMVVPKLTVNGQTLSTTETGQGISIVYNYPNCTGTVNGPDESEFGHVIAPKALVKIMGGNYSGTMIGNNAFIGPDAEGHLYPYKGGELVGFYGEIDLSKKIKNSEESTELHDPTERQKYTFNVKQLYKELNTEEYNEIKTALKTDDEQIIFWEDLQSVNNSGNKVVFEDVSFTQKGTYYFLISEDQTNTKENETRDNTRYLIECTVNSRTEGEKTVLYLDTEKPLKYYRVTDEANLVNVTDLMSDDATPVAIGKKAEINTAAVQELSGPLVWAEGKLTTDITYINTVETTEAGVTLTGTKTLEGYSLDKVHFAFTVTGPDGSVNVVARGASNDEGEITFTPRLTYSSEIFNTLGADVNEIIYTYVIKEDIPEDATTDPETGKPTKNGVIYDDSEKTVRVKVTVNPVTDELSATVLEEDADNIAFSNTFRKGKLKVQKSVVSDITADHTKDFSFTVTLSDTTVTGIFGEMEFTDGVATFTLKDTESLEAIGLPENITYTVEETADNDFTTQAANVSGTVTENTNTALFTNTRKTGELDISKTVVSPIPAEKTQSFNFTVTLTYGEGEQKQKLNGTYGGYAFDENGQATIPVTGGQTVKITGIPIGASFTVDEVTNSNFSTTSTGETGSVKSTVSTAEFTNTRKTGKISISKNVVSIIAAEANKAFTFTIKLSNDTISGNFIGKITPATTDGEEYDATTVTFDDGEATVTVCGGQTLTVEGLPTGITYTVTETADENFNSEKTTAHEGGITETGTTDAFKNTRKNGELQVGKTVSGTSDKTKVFHFEVTLTYGGEAFSGTFPVEVHATGDQATQFADNNENKITFNAGKAIFTLKADEYIIVKDLPIGVVYSVKEENTTTAPMPEGYELSDPANNNATGTISTTRSVAEFTNNYSLQTISVNFGGVKSIEGTDSTDKVFTFDLYQADDNTFNISGKNPIDTVSTSETIGTAGATFAFDTITYSDAGENNAGKDYYYVIKERAFNDSDEDDTNNSEGWTASTVVYTVHVHISDAGNGQLAKTVQVYKDGALVNNGNTGALNFMNTYSAKGDLDFKVKKNFIKGTLAADQFSFRLTQVTGNGKTGADGTPEKVILPSSITANVTAGGIAEFASISLNKNKDKNDCGTYWFLLEEVIPTDAENYIKSNIQYDPAKKWIQVTVSDHEDGTLTVLKDPTPTTENNVDLDATFTNEQLGNLKVTKVFEGHAVPDGFKIKATYKDKDNVEQVVEFNVGNATATDPYTWELKNLPIDTAVTFTEEGIQVDGYTVSTTFNGTATADSNGSLTVKKDEQTGAFINTYTREEGSLKIKKTVSVNGNTTIAAEDTHLVDGTYFFNVTGTTGTLTAGVSRRVSITVSGGVVTEAKDETDSTNIKPLTINANKEAVLSGLPTGQYTVTEDLATEQKADGITLAVEQNTTITVESDQKEGVTVKTASFRNNRDAGDLEISKNVSGTTDHTKDFTFTVVLTPPTSPAELVFRDVYPVETTTAVKSNAGNASIFDADGNIKLTDGGNGTKTVTIKLKATESIKIKDLPAGTGYTVTEITPLPSGYTNTSGTPTGAIGSETSSAAFINNYELETTSVYFSGVKSIEGTDSTEKQFRFELYETGKDDTQSNKYLIATDQEPIQTVHTDGTIQQSAGKNYQFEAITYSVIPKENTTPIEFEQDDRGDHYYVIKEKAFNADAYKAEGWTLSDVEYHIHVNVADGGDGSLTKTVTVYDKNGTEISENTNALNFTNTYQATGNVAFNAKKEMAHGTLSDGTFSFKLTQVTGQDSYTQATSENVTTAVKLNSTITANVDTTTGIAAFTPTITFDKNTSTNDCGTYWFLLEEVIPTDAENNIKNSIQYDPAKKWIQVTVSDRGDGSLTVIKDPAPTKENQVDIDATFTNDKLGSVKVQKIFAGDQTAVPGDFKITAEYTLPGQNKTTIELKTTDTTNRTGDGTAANPYEWTILDLPVGTQVTFTESGITVDGYTVEVSGDATASEDGKAATLNTVAALEPTAAKFINTYTRDTGSLKIQKTVSVNGSTTIADTSLVDDTYTFQVAGTENTLTAGINKTITIKISGGIVTEAKDITNSNSPIDILDSENKVAVLSGLPTGQYTVTEVLSADQIAKGITLAAKPETAITVVKTADGVKVETALFRNNRNVGDLEIKKAVTGTSDTTKDFTFTITLTAPDAPASVVLENAYPVETTSAVEENNDSISESDGKSVISLTQAQSGKTVTVKLKANESIKIKDLPDGTGYTVTEETLPTGYNNTTGSFNGSISSTLSSCEFINNYTLGTTSVTFGGQKFIEGTDSTEKEFYFELHETGENYTTSATTLKQSVHTTGSILKDNGSNYEFDEIVYSVVQDANDPAVFTVDDRGDHYYVIKEKAFDADTYPAEGWTEPDVEYHIHVNVADNGEGSLTKTVTVYDKTGAAVSGGNEGALNYTNTYSAIGSITFSAKKEFTNGTIASDGQFQFKLTQVDNGTATTQAASPTKVILDSPITADVDASTGIATFDKITFLKNKTDGNDCGTYWFLLEEVIDGVDENNIKDGIQYDPTKKWIQVTVTDHGDGTLTVVKNPTPTKEGETDLDATFTNEQLGSVKVTKAFVGLATDDIPAIFKITAAYKDINGTDQTKELTIANALKDGDNYVTPYTWEIKDLKIGTTVSFTESGMTVNRYTLSVSGDATASADKQTATASASAAITPETAEFINTYTKHTTYAPKITKQVKMGETVVDTNWPKDGFDFVLTAKSSNPDGAELPTDTSGTATKDNKQATFGDITFSAVGVYTFSMTEQVPAAAAQNGNKLDGITYNDTPVDVIVDVRENDNHELFVYSVKYGTAAEVTTNIVDATGEITNTYSTTGTNIVFGGTKFIEGTDETETVFTFDLYETKSDYVVDDDSTLVRSISTTGKITTSQAYSFTAIEYEMDDVGDHYYVIRERALTGSDANCWDENTAEYHEHVSVSHSGGEMSAVVVSTNSTTSDRNALDFTNTYHATGSVTFNAKKEFTNGTIATDGQFQFRLTQVDNGTATTQATSPTKIILESSITANANAFTGIATFDAIALRKNKTYGDDCGTYWFLLEEVIDGVDSNNIKDGIQYDPAQKWIRVTVTDHGDGTLTVVKNPTPTRERETDLDATFTNEQLGSVKVTKAFVGLATDEIPEGFKITAAYKDVNGTDQTKELTIAGAVKDGDIYTWEIKDLKLNTPVSFTESGIVVDGYTLSVSGDATASADKQTATASASAAIIPNTARFINTYTKHATYAPKITKQVKMGETVVEDSKWPDDGFDFVLTAKSSNPDGAELPTDTSETATKDNKQATFGDITFSAIGVYTFSMTEQVPAAAAQNGNKLDGITYNSTPVDVVVDVRENANHELFVYSVKYGTAAEVTTNIADATGVITNTYSTTGINIVFSGTKYITGTDETETVFTFDLYETGADYKVLSGDVPLRSISTTGKITTSQDYSFAAIEYGPTNVGRHYYVIKERALTGNDTVGWDENTTEYHEHVLVSDSNGTMTAEIVNGSDKLNKDALDFTNAYHATGTVTFAAEKEFTGGNLKEHNFVIRLMQVTGDGSITQATENSTTHVVLDTQITKRLTADASSETVTFGVDQGEKINFIKNNTQNDTTYEYWFLIEEIVPREGNTDSGDPISIQDGIQYDATARHWIKVTLTDDGEGHLTPVKSSGATGSNPDVQFTNKQLGGVKVRKIFDGPIPSNFKITAKYQPEGQDETVVDLTEQGRTGAGTTEDPFIWEINELPIGIPVTFTESGITVDGYSLETTFNGTAVADQTAPSGTLNAGKKPSDGDYPTGTFINTYTRETGSLQITKTVKVNNANPSTNAEHALVNGTYEFTVTGSGLADGETRTVEVTISNGVVTGGKIDNQEVTPTGGYIVIPDLPTGNYTITETITDDMKHKGIVLKDPASNSITKEVTANNTSNIPSAEFTNEKDVGALEVTKSVSGTSDRTKIFTFVITLTPVGDVVLESSYPITAADSVKTDTENAKIITDNKIALTPVNNSTQKTVTIRLKADESLIISELPVGTGYKVEELTDTTDMPGGYELIEASGAQDAIAMGETKTASFVNQYKMGTTSITFSGKKTISGTESTNRKFTFELYETDSDYSIEGKTAKKTVSTSGAIGTSGQNYSFSLSYGPNDVEEVTVEGVAVKQKTYYYVIKEQALEENETGWITSTVEYHEEVLVKDENNGTMTATVKRSQKIDGDTVTSGIEKTALDFENKYSADGTLGFRAKKVFTDGDLTKHAFIFRLTQVKGDGLPTPASEKLILKENGKAITVGGTNSALAVFDSNIKPLVKNASTNMCGEYWFLLEEVVPTSGMNGNIETATDIQYETASQKWIKVTVTDGGSGKLNVEKSVATTTDGTDTDLDAVFTNTQLGCIKVTKTISGDLTTLPADFQITAKYELNGQEKTDILKVGNATQDGSTYTWEYKDMPIGTKFTFTESYADESGYTLETKYNGEVITDGVGLLEVKVDEIPVGAFENNYTRDEGSLKFRKTVTLNGKATDTTKVDGTYSFTITGFANTLTDGITRTISYKIEGGKPTEATVTNGSETKPLSIEEGYVLITGLPTGQYTVSETISVDMTNKMISPDKQSTSALEVVKDETGAIVPIAEFVNNRELGELEISKTVKRTTNNTKEFTFIITLKKGTTPLSGTVEYPAEWTLNKGTRDPKVTFTNGEATVTLCADEKVLIKDIPAGINYIVEEKKNNDGVPLATDGTTPLGGYEQTIPAGGADATGTIGHTTSTAAFENTYNLQSTSLSFGGFKSIEGTDSTTETFTFKLYECADETYDYTADTAQLRFTKSTTGTITAANPVSYTLGTFKYEEAGTHYYVVLEEDAGDGWTKDNIIYKEKVVVEDKDGKLIKTITGTKADTAAMNFTNSYTATGEVTFRVSKTLTNGTMTDGQFNFCLTQVKAKNSTEAPDASKTKLSGPVYASVDTSTGTATFNAISFTKDKNKDESGEYWFLLEEVVPSGVTATSPISGGIRYDTNRKWIKVTMTDNCAGTLTVGKDPAVTTVNAVDLDAQFVNEQLGKLIIDKQFAGNATGKLTDAQKKSLRFTIKGAAGTNTADYEETFEYGKDDSSRNAVWNNDVLTVSDLKIGQYEVTETDDEYRDGNDLSLFIHSKEYSVGNSSGVQEIGSSISGNTITITNTYDTAELVITKIVSGIQTVKPATMKIVFTVTGGNLASPIVKTLTYPTDFTNGNAKITLTNQDGIELGKTYTVTETATSANATGYTRTTTISSTDFTQESGTNPSGSVKTDATTGKGGITIANAYKLDVGSVIVTKIFTGTPKLPEGFKIVNDYNDDVFTAANAIEGDGLTTPFKWMIKDVPVDTVITFTESNTAVTGYALSTATVTEKACPAVVKDSTVNVEFANEYTPNDGCLKLLKTVTVNGAETDTTLVDGEYAFTVTSVDDTTVVKNVTVTIKNGKVDNVGGDAVKDGSSAKLTGLAPGKYTVAEKLTDDQVKKGIALVKQSATEVTVIPDGTGEIPTVEFTNNVNRIKVQKIDVTTEEELTGAHIQILDKDGKVVEEWDSDKNAPHEVTGLKTGEEYTLRETVAPKGYDITSDTKFSIDENGKITTSGNTTKDENGEIVLLVEDLPLTTTVAVRKVWKDENNRDGLRPISLTVRLKMNGTVVATRQLTIENNWTWVEKDLRKCDADGKEITYSWEEDVPKGYKLESTKNTGMLTTLTNVYTPETVSISVKKTWNDEGNKYGTRPASVKVQLFANGKAEGDAVTLNEANGWTTTWKDLCKYENTSGKTGGSKEITYTVAELGVPAGYTMSVSGNAAKGFVITNSIERGKLVIQKKFVIEENDKEPEFNPAFIDIPVEKIWDDNGNKDGNRPDSITVKLLCGGEVIDQATLTKDTGWKHTFTDLPKYKNNLTVRYSIQEEPVEGYVARIDGYTIRNVYTPTLTSVTVRKVWDDAGNETHRPQSIIMHLSNGKNVVLDEKNGWTATVTNLPTVMNGKPMTYSWTEARAPGYVLESVVVNGSVTTFTNKPVGEPDMGNKKVKTGGDSWAVFEEYDTALGGQLLINHVGDCFD